MKIITRKCGSRWQAELKGVDGIHYDNTYIGAVGSLVTARAKELGIEIKKVKPVKQHRIFANCKK